jgi:hypothetical protein
VACPIKNLKNNPMHSSLSVVLLDVFCARQIALTRRAKHWQPAMIA